MNKDDNNQKSKNKKSWNRQLDKVIEEKRKNIQKFKENHETFKNKA